MIQSQTSDKQVSPSKVEVSVPVYPWHHMAWHLTESDGHQGESWRSRILPSTREREASAHNHFAQKDLLHTGFENYKDHKDFKKFRNSYKKRLKTIWGQEETNDEMRLKRKRTHKEPDNYYPPHYSVQCDIISRDLCWAITTLGLALSGRYKPNEMLTF